MTGKELYELYKGKKVNVSGDDGVICGYDDEYMIMAVSGAIYDHEPFTGWIPGWTELGGDDVIMVNKDNTLGYHYVSKESIID